MIKGIVQKGEGRGTALGYPTANIVLEDVSISGIYAARVRIDETEYEAAIFADPARKILEAHILDFSGDLYGETIGVTLLEKIRDTKIFTNDEELRRAISEDIVAVCKYFKRV